MRKQWFLITAAILLVIMIGTSCSEKETDSTSPPDTKAPATASAGTATTGAVSSSSPSPSADTQKSVLDKYEALLEMQGNEKAIIAAIRQDISKVSPDNADRMILAFETYQTAAIARGALLSSKLIESIQTADEPYNEINLNDLSKITNTDLKNLLQTLFDKGYKIIVPEGMYEAVIDYSIYEDAQEYVSPDIAAYIDIMVKESERRMSEDAAIIIPIDEVFTRALAAESFILTYPDSVKTERVEQMHANYVDAFFFGQNNTPAFEYTSKKLGQEFIDSYEKAASSGDSAIAKVAGKYLKILKENNYTLTNAVNDYRKDMTDALKTMAS